MAGVMVLGPSTFLAGEEQESALHVPPKQGRDIIAGVLAQLECDAFTLEGKPIHDGETKMRRFMRLIRTEQVETFLLFWPRGTLLRELDVEIGHLLTRIVEGSTAPEDILIVVEDGNEPLRHDEGEPVLGHDGDSEERVQHYAELVDEGCQVRRWSDLESLSYVVAGVAIEHRQRHRKAKMAELVKMVHPDLPKSEAAGTESV